MKNQHHIGLLLGRFQPFHFGHLSAIKQGLEQCDEMIIVIGSANRNFSIDNPLTIDERIEILNTAIVKEGLKDQINLLMQFDDNPNNLEWVDSIISAVPKFDLVVGNNNLVSVLTSYRGYDQFKPKLTRRELHQGRIIRHAILDHRQWKDLVPEYTHALLEKFDFENRLRILGTKGD